ncbi:MAG TPA: hypothetical protein VFA99_12345 [Acidobacteriaceae bacterium]|nr:hypothetical protein [Acidobacteriaceae bacterium]
MTLRDRLTTGTTRDLGPTDEIVDEALHNHALIQQLIDALDDNRGVVPHRASNALKKIQRSNPKLIDPYAKRILQATLVTEHMHTRWNLTIILGELPLRGREKSLAIDLMFESLSSRSALQRAFALTALTNYAHNDPTLRTRIHPILQRALTDPSAAIRARTRQLLKQLGSS